MDKINTAMKVFKEDKSEKKVQKKGKVKLRASKKEIPEFAHVNYVERNRKVAKNRGESWKNALLKSSFERAKGPVTKMKALRVKAGLTQIEFLKKLPGHLSATSYRNVESGKRWVDATLAKRISRLLASSVDVLFEKKKDKYRAI